MTDTLRGEAWALAQTERKLPIDFPQSWPEEERTISGEIVASIISDPGWANTNSGFVVANTIIASPIGLNNVQIKCEAHFHNCLFKKAVKLSHVQFERRARFSRCIFEGELDMVFCHGSELWFVSELHFENLENEVGSVFHDNVNFLRSTFSGPLIMDKALFKGEGKSIVFNSITVDGSMIFREAIFRSAVDFGGIKIGQQIWAERAQFLCEKGAITFDGAEVSSDVLLNRASFRGQVSFTTAKINGQLMCDNAEFLSREKSVSFNSAKVKGHASFSEAVFHGPVDFTVGEFTGSVICNKTQFLSTQEPVNFYAITIMGIALFEGAIFHGPVTFIRGEIRLDLRCAKAQFLNAQKTVSFNGTKVMGHAFFSETAFHGQVDFTTFETDGQLICSKAQFLNAQETVKFDSAKVKGHTSFDEAVFHGPVAFTAFETDGQLNCSKAQFLNAQETVKFDSAKVKRQASFSEAVFHGPVAFTAFETDGELNCANAQFLNATAVVTFNSARVKETAFLRECIFRGPVHLVHCKFSRNVTLMGAQFNNSLNFLNTTIDGNLYIFSEGADVPTDEAAGLPHKTILPLQANLQALTYRDTDLANGMRWKEWIKLFAQDRYEPDPFLTLESSFRRTGRGDLADNVHYEMGKAEGRYLLHQIKHNEHLRFDKWLWNQFLRLTVGYGVYGRRLFLWAMGIFLVDVALSYWWQAELSPVKDTTELLLPFWYALDRFIPGLDFHQEDSFRPKGELLLTLFNCIAILGWVIVPLALVQLAGLFKKNE